MSRIAKPCTLFTTMTGNPGDHIRYLFDGHGMDGHEHQVWTKSIPKSAREIVKIGAYWDAIHDKWQEHTVTQAQMTGKQVFIALPNDISEAEIQKIARAVLRTVPQHHPATMTVHFTSGKNNKQNVHLHGVISMRRGGYGKTNDQYRLNARNLAKQAVDKTLKKCGYEIHQNAKVVKTRPHRFEVQRLLRQYTEDQLKSPEYLRCFVLPHEKGRTKRWLKEEISKLENKQFEDMYNFSSELTPFLQIFDHREPPSKMAGLPASADLRLKQKVIASTDPASEGVKLNYLKQLIENHKSSAPVKDDSLSRHDTTRWGGVTAETAGGTYTVNESTTKGNNINMQLSKVTNNIKNRKGLRKCIPHKSLN